jgi:hypothetical protein
VCLKNCCWPTCSILLTLLWLQDAWVTVAWRSGTAGKVNITAGEGWAQFTQFQ